MNGRRVSYSVSKQKAPSLSLFTSPLFLPMSGGDQPMVVHSDEAYRMNKERLEQMQDYLNAANAVNEQGKRNYDQLADELQRKIREGEEAQRMLAALQTGRPLLTYHEPEASNSNLLPLGYPPARVNPAPSARIEEVPSPGRHPKMQQSDTFHQPNYVQSHAQNSSEPHQSYRPYEQPRPNPHFSGQSQNESSSSNLHGALGQQPQAQQNRYSYTAPQQPHQSSSRSQTHTQPRETPPFIPPQNVPSDSRPHPQPQAGPSSQSNHRLQPYSYSQQRDPPTVPPAQSHRSQVTLGGGPPAAANPVQSQPNTFLFGVFNSRQSHPRETPLRQPDPPPQIQPPRQPPMQPNPRRETPSQGGPSASSIQSKHSAQMQSQPQPLPPKQSTSRLQAPPQSQPPSQPNVQPQPQSQTRPLPPPIGLNSWQGKVDSWTSNGVSQKGEASGATSQAPQAPTPKDSQPLSTAAQVKPSVPATASAPNPSYGMSPFAHIPTPVASKAPPKSNPSAVPSRTPLPSTENPLRKLAPSQGVSAQPSSSTSKTGSPTESQRYMAFLKLINAWQRASPPNAHLEIPHAQLRAVKYPTGEIHFMYREETRISALTAFSRLRFQGFASIFVNPKGLPTMLMEPLPAAMAATYKRFAGVTPENAPHATFPDPPPSAPPANRDLTSTRNPKDVDKRFIAHDVLRALGKGDLYASEDSVRYAKRRALEASEFAEPSPFVARPIHSNESSAKTTPAPSRSPSVPLAAQRVPSVPLAAQRVPLFLPPSSPPPMAPPVQSRARSIADAEPPSPRFYVLVPPAPTYVKRHRAQMHAHTLPRTPSPTQQEEVEEPPMEAEEVEETEPEVDVKELKRRRALGMKQSLKVCRAQR
ncbi:hypothetical protein DFH09DRAFT_1159994 [Mycena vulgaris]|nr:hypothetical protein DFH09DRAFT_1159994 [Mycena vulgaris]